MKKYLPTIYVLFLINFALKAQDLEKLKDLKSPKAMLKGKGLSVKGSINATYTLNNISGLENRRPPMNYLVSGSLTFDFFGKIKMPVNFSFMNQNATLTNPFAQGLPLAQPFNRMVFKPAYKGFVMQIGTVSQTFSPYTLAGHRYEGVGLNYKGKKFPLYGGIMLGTLQRSIQPDTTTPNSKPVYHRTGFGFQLGYKKEKDFVELILFSAQDDYQVQIPSLDRFKVLPQSNVVTSLKFAKMIKKKLFFESEIAVSGLSKDSRSPEGIRPYGFLRSFGGLLNTNASTVYRKALKTSLNYKAETYTVGVEYSRIDPEYKTLGGYYFLNDMETYGLKGSTQLFKKKVSFSSDVAIQNDNLDKTKPQTAQRLVLALNGTYAPSEKMNMTLSFSNFSNYSNFNPQYQYLARTTQLSGLDTLNYRQINQNIQGNVFYQLPSSSKTIKRSVIASGVFQAGKDQVGGAENNNNLVNLSVNVTQANEATKSNFSGGFNFTNTTSPTLNNLIIGPIANYTKSLFKDKLSLNANVGYATSTTQSPLFEAQSSTILTSRLGITYKLLNKHSFQLNAILLKKNTPKLDTYSSNFTETTITFGYHHDFSLLDLKFK